MSRYLDNVIYCNLGTRKYELKAQNQIQQIYIYAIY